MPPTVTTTATVPLTGTVTDTEGLIVGVPVGVALEDAAADAVGVVRRVADEGADVDLLTCCDAVAARPRVPEPVGLGLTDGPWVSDAPWVNDALALDEVDSTKDADADTARVWDEDAEGVSDSVIVEATVTEADAASESVLLAVDDRASVVVALRVRVIAERVAVSDCAALRVADSE